MSAPTPSRSRSPWLIGGILGAACLLIIGVLVVALIAGGYLFGMGGQEDPTPSGDPVTTATDPQTGGGSSDGGGASDGGGEQMALPPGVEDGQTYLTMGDGPVVVDVYSDFACPHCAVFSDVNGDDLEEMIEDGKITLQIHPRPMLDERTTPPGYSSRAANAAVCAYAETGDPEDWFDAEEALFEIQAEGAGMSPEELAGVVEDATDIDVTDCVTGETYVSWLQDVVEPEARQSTPGTPVVFINGTMAEGDWSVAGELTAQIDAAQ